MRTKILFIYRDGTLVKRINYKFNKVFLSTRAIISLERCITELFYNFVLVNNEVDLGTENFPRIIFSAPHKFILLIFDKGGIPLLFVYMTPLSFKNNKYIVFDIIFLTYNGLFLNKGFCMLHSFPWNKIYNLLKFCFNECSYRRKSKETDIQLCFKKNSKGNSFIKTGFGFFDHMIDQICIHTNIDLALKIYGDIYVDEHHSIEDTAISIGYAVSSILKDKRGIARYGFLLPMDDALVQIALDISGRNNFIWKVSFEREKIGDLPNEMFLHFFKSFSHVVYCNLHITAEGDNDHHKIEAIFKAFACTLKIAIKHNMNDSKLPSTKEIL